VSVSLFPPAAAVSASSPDLTLTIVAFVVSGEESGWVGVLDDVVGGEDPSPVSEVGGGGGGGPLLPEGGFCGGGKVDVDDDKVDEDASLLSPSTAVVDSSTRVF